MINPFLELYMDFSDNFRYDIQGVHEIQTEIEKVVVFDEETDNAWCNTILMSYRYSEDIGFLIPSGIGISLIVRQEELAFPLKSKYVFLPNGEDLFLENELKLQKLVSLSEGEIYFNIDSGCSIQN